MDGPGDYHTEWSKSDREREISYDIAYMQNLIKWYKWTYLQNRNRLTDLESYGYQAGKIGGNSNSIWSWHAHTSVFKVDNQGLLCSTGNYAQYSVTT